MTVSEMRVMGPEGDTSLTWDPDNEGEVEAARRMFDTLRGKGYLAYSMEAGGQRGEVIRTFDREAERMVMAPPLRGG